MAELEAPTENVATEVSNFEDAVDVGSVARLEVLVVDGNWETTELQNANITDLSQSEVIHSNGHILTHINEDWENQNFGGVQNFWVSSEIQPLSPRHFFNRGCQIPRVQENNQVEDQENGNLSWLLDFKLDSLIEAADDRSTILPPKDNQSGENLKKLIFIF